MNCVLIILRTLRNLKIVDLDLQGQIVIQTSEILKILLKILHHCTLWNLTFKHNLCIDHPKDSDEFENW